MDYKRPETANLGLPALPRRHPLSNDPQTLVVYIVDIAHPAWNAARSIWGYVGTPPGLPKSQPGPELRCGGLFPNERITGQNRELGIGQQCTIKQMLQMMVGSRRPAVGGCRRCHACCVKTSQPGANQPATLRRLIRIRFLDASKRPFSFCLSVGVR
jgi:hypothetical protein